jgi:hypothetical protein
MMAGCIAPRRHCGAGAEQHESRQGKRYAQLPLNEVIHFQVLSED